MTTKIVLGAVALVAVALAGTPTPGFAFGDGKKGMMGGKKGMMAGKGRMGGGDAAGADGADSSDSRPNPEVMGAFMARKADEDAMDARGLLKTGLRPVYPEGLDCHTGDSFHGDTTRGNGSARSQKFYKGRHGGFDIPAAEGTPVIAIADGEVVSKKEGGGIGGIGVVLRHSPDDTGLPVWVFTEYKHHPEMPDLQIGQRVRMGDAVGAARASGTTGGRAYGPAGHSHLHLSAWYNTTGDYKEGRIMFIPKDGYWMDPLALFIAPPMASADVRDLPDDRKQVRFPYMTADGSFHPADTKLVWPFVCR